MPIDIKVIEEILAVDYSRSGPLAHVEEVIMPEPLEAKSARSLYQKTKGKRGPKSSEEWVTEMRRVWRHIDEEDQLRKSWLAYLPQVRDLAASKYCGRSTGRGPALRELLRKAITEAQQYSTDEKSHEILPKYPRVKMKEIAAQFGLSREHFSRTFGAKAAGLVVRAFQHLLTQPM